MPDFLIVSLVLSVVLTVVLNVGLRLFPKTGEQAARRLEERLDRRVSDPQGRRVQVFFREPPSSGSAVAVCYDRSRPRRKQVW